MFTKYALRQVLAVIGVMVMGCSLNAHAVATSAKPPVKAEKWEEKEQIMKYDQVDSTDALAIPLDDSEVEDEELIEEMEGQDTFPLQTKPSHKH